jgi:hypothetical protein
MRSPPKSVYVKTAIHVIAETGLALAYLPDDSAIAVLYSIAALADLAYLIHLLREKDQQ